MYEVESTEFVNGLKMRNGGLNNGPQRYLRLNPWNLQMLLYIVKGTLQVWLR